MRHRRVEPGRRTRAGQLPERTRPELVGLLGQVWPRVRDDGLQVVTGPCPAGSRVLDSFRVVPSIARAQMLLPADATVAARSLVHYDRLREPRARAYRRAVAVALRAPGGHGRPFELLSICTDAMEATPPTELSLTHWLAERLGAGPLAAAIGLTNPGPNRKPILQLFDASGQPVAFVKVGWNDVTRPMVENEAVTLRALANEEVVSPARPKVLLHARWQGLSVLATAPLPLDVRAHPREQAPPGLLHGDRTAGAVEVCDLQSSAYWQRLRAGLADLHAAGTLPEEDVATLRQQVERVEAVGDGRTVAFGRWHGDWVYWNMARQGDRLWAWDWEHSSPSAPVGFDALHFAFQREFIRRRRPFADALAAAAREARQAPDPHQPAGAVDLVATELYPLELYLRAARMFVQGAGWNPRMREGARAWVGGRTR